MTDQDYVAMDWATWLAKPTPPALRALAKRITTELPGCHALVSRFLTPTPGPWQVWIVQGPRQAYITTWEEAQAFAGVAVQGTLFGDATPK